MICINASYCYILLIAGLAYIASGCKTAGDVSKNEVVNPPNVVFILADDLGYSELGSYGNTFNETPNLDTMAVNGIRFTNAYAAAPVCSPYRAALMTGQYPARLGITDYLRPDDSVHLDTAHVTIAEMFQNNGYATGMVGKWHLTGYENHGAEEFSPDMHGFDEVSLSENRGIANVSYFHPYHFNLEIEKKLAGEKEYLTDRISAEAVEFIEQHQDKPFFLYVSHYAVHTMVHGKPDLVDHFRRKEGAGTSSPSKKNPENDPYKKWPADFFAPENNPHLAAQLFSIDESVGNIMQALKRLGLDENTIVIFTSDNGGESRVTSNAPLRGGKSSLYEGGTREPLIISYPQKFAQGKLCDVPVINYDFYTTLIELIGGQLSPEQKMDGISFASLLTNPEGRLNERDLFWHYPLEKPHFLGGRSSGSIRSGNWKLIEYFDTGEQELFNLENDPGESHNLALDNPGLVDDLQARLSQWRKSVDASTMEGQAFK
jgi:arylsulfatase A